MQAESVAHRTSSPLAPAWHRVVTRRRHTADVVTIGVTPVTGSWPSFRAGQFNMLTAIGRGEAAISISGRPETQGVLEHTVRDVGPVTEALCRAEIGDVIGVRGPFGSDWGTDELVSGRAAIDVVVVAGGIGLAPLRGAVYELVSGLELGRSRLWVLVGARQPDQVIFAEDLRAWTESGAVVAVTVDVGNPAWTGRVGMVTSLLADAGFDAGRTAALLCGPEIMMRFTARALVDMGVDPGRIRVSLERNMQCGLGWCGHCQLGPFLLCRDGPVLPYGGPVARLLTERER